jgi:hypothetical protein
MSAASNFLEAKILDHVLRFGTAPYTAPSTVYVALFNNTSGNAIANLEAGVLTDEVSTSGTAYARQAVTFAAAATNEGTGATTIASNASVTFPTATGAGFGTVTHIALMDSDVEGSGNVTFYGALATSKSVGVDDTFSIASGALTVSLA